jgi:hypothetical protein
MGNRSVTQPDVSHIEDREAAIPSTTFQWRRNESGWRLYAGRRKFACVVRDSRYPGMWRSTLANGRFSGMANLSWARNAVLQVAIRELEYELRATTPSICPESAGVFESTGALTGLEAAGGTGDRPEEVAALPVQVATTDGVGRAEGWVSKVAGLPAQVATAGVSS